MLENMPDVGLLIIDGIRDLMYDINSPSESTDLINLLMPFRIVKPANPAIALETILLAEVRDESGENIINS